VHPGSTNKSRLLDYGAAHRGAILRIPATLQLRTITPARSIPRVLINEGIAMSDDLKQTGNPDDARINIEQEHEVSYWAEKLSVSPETLRSVVQRAGPLVKDVRRQLDGSGG
jgi:hypothetical protein